MEEARTERDTPSRSTAYEDALGSGISSLRRKLIIGVLLAALVLIGLAIAFAWRQYDAGRRSAVNEAKTRAVLASSILNTYFGGELSTLDAIAKAPAFLSLDRPAMYATLRRIQPHNGKLFNGGIGWIDRVGMARVSSNATRAVFHGPNVAGRSYVKAVLATGKPFVSEGLVSLRKHQQVIVLAVPTRNVRGAVTGLLAGALIVKPKPTSKATLDLGYAGLAILDRKNQLVLGDLARPRNLALVARLRKAGSGALSSSSSLEGSPGHVVAYAVTPLPDWLVVIDRPRSAVFASARHSLLLELISIAVAGLAVLTLIAWIGARSRREGEKERERTRQWSALSRSLGGAAGSRDVSTALIDAIAATIPGSVSLVSVAVEDRPGLRISAVTAGVRGTIQADLRQAAGLAYESGSVLELDDEPVRRRRLLRFERLLPRPARSRYAIPLEAQDGQPLGAVAVLLPEGHALSGQERSLLAAHAERAAETLSRARRFEREHEIATRLQRSLLAVDLPVTDGVDLAGRYQAGDAGLAIGGDWYDAVRRPDGIVHLTVGDVAGRGIAAAALMGELRHAFRAYAHDNVSPAEILRRMARHVGGDQMATAVCLTVDPYTRELVCAGAGHPPPLLLDTETGDVSELQVVSVPPLGHADPAAVREVVVELPAHATIAAYTDGLVEHRGTSIDEGIARVAALLAAGASLPAGRLADLVLREAGNGEGDDDIALLIVELPAVPGSVKIEVPAHPSALAGLRRRLRTWLELRGVPVEAAEDVVLATSEACNNAIEHAYLDVGGTIELLVEHRDASLRIIVRDRGSWRPLSRSDERGRGLLIMETTMDAAVVEQVPGGTQVTLELRL